MTEQRAGEQTLEEWRKPWMDDAFIEWWLSLDHSNCAQYGPPVEAPDYQLCHSMHCPNCGKPTGAQGHRNCPVVSS